MPAEAVGPGHREVVGEIVCSDGEVGRRLVLPFLSQVYPILAYEGIAWALGHVEAGGADY